MTPRSTPRSAAAAILAFGVLVGAVACSADEAPRERGTRDRSVDAVVESDTQAQSGGTLRYGLVAESSGWNPASTVWTSSGEEVSRAIFDRLAAFDEHGDARPDLAESITANADHTRWDVRVRPDVTLHDGEPVTAHTVAAGLEVYRSSPTTAAMLGPVESVTAVDDLTVQITMDQPWVDFTDTLTSQVGIVADPVWLASGDQLDPVGTGPFVLADWRPGELLVANRNPTYWRTDHSDRQLPYLDTVVFEPVHDPEVRAAKLDAGQFDIIQTDSADQLERFIELGDKTTTQIFDDVEGESPELFIQLNTATAPFADPDLRRALVLGTDPPTFVDVLDRDLYVPARGPFDPESPWYAETDYPDYDPEAARDLVELASTRTAEPVTFTVLGSSDSHTLSALQLLQEQWKNVGITAVIEVAPPAELAHRVAVGDYQAVLWEQFDGPQPSVDLVRWDPAAAAPISVPAFNSARNDDPEIGATIASLRAATTNDERRALYATIQAQLAADLPYVWLVHGVRGVLAGEDVVNVVRYTLPGGETGIELERGTHPLWQVWTTR